MNPIDSIHHTLDIQELRESVQLIVLAVGQIEAGMAEGSHSVDSLIDIFKSMSSSLKSQISTRERSQDLVELKADIDQSIISFQFYDRLQQRLTHVVDALSMLSDLVSNKESLEDTQKWDALKINIRKSYSMESESILFKLLYSDGLNIHDALTQIKKYNDESVNNEDIELF